MTSGAGGDEDDLDPRRLRPLPGSALAIPAVLGLVGGWLLRPLGERIWTTAPYVEWLQVMVLGFVAAILAGTAWVTWRAVHVRRERVEAHRMVNRLVLARACALAGALVAGGYAGYAVAWLGVPAELATQRVVRSSVAALAGAAITATALLLERACRAPSADAEP